MHTTLQSALRDAVADGLISRNPAERAHSEPKNTGDDLQSWTADELTRFLRSIEATGGRRCSVSSPSPE